MKYIVIGIDEYIGDNEIEVFEIEARNVLQLYAEIYRKKYDCDGDSMLYDLEDSRELKEYLKDISENCYDDEGVRIDREWFEDFFDQSSGSGFDLISIVKGTSIYDNVNNRGGERRESKRTSQTRSGKARGKLPDWF